MNLSNVTSKNQDAYLHEVGIPKGDVISPHLVVLVILRDARIVLSESSYCQGSTILPYLVVSGPLDDLLEDGSIHVGEWDNLLVLDIVLLKTFLQVPRFH